jgi:hypothetical protein
VDVSLRKQRNALLLATRVDEDKGLAEPHAGQFHVPICRLCGVTIIYQAKRTQHSFRFVSEVGDAITRDNSDEAMVILT